VNKFSKVKLGKRLTRIESTVDMGYDHIWDCCCDHGLLGFQLLEKDKAKHVHFVDIVAPLLVDIEAKLKRFYQGESEWHVHCIDVALLPIKQYKDETHLLIIAGIGGQLLIEILEKLLPLTIGLNIEFVLSPVHHNYQLRSFLSSNNYALITESIVEENNRFYEVLHIKNSPGKPISLVGDIMWDFSHSHHQSYLLQIINHYQRIAKNPNVDVEEIIRAYQALKLFPR